MESEKVKEVKKALEDLDMICYEKTCSDKIDKISKYINELESENECYKQSCEAIGQNSLTIINQLKDRIAELEEGIAKSMLGCEFLPECTKEIAEKIWNMSKIIVNATKHIVQGREYLHLDTLKEIIKSCGVEIKE